MKEKVIQDGSGRKLLRRNPKQDRSRDRIDDIIAVAQQLIGEKGIDAVTMKEIGTLTGGPISSVYQYFRDKDGILAMIYEQHLELTRKIVADILGTISTPSDALIAPARMFDIYYSRMRELPHALEFLAAIKASKFNPEKYPNFGKAPKGYLGIQGDHPGTLALRNIRIRELQ